MEQTPNLIKKFVGIKEKISIFKNMNEADILSIVKEVKFIKFKPGELLMREGLMGEDVFYILSGNCSIIANRKIIGSFGSNTLIGEIASMTKEKRNASVRATEEVNAFSFKINYTKEHKVPMSFCKYYKNIAFELADKLSASNAKK